MRLIDADFEEEHYASMLLNPTPDVTDKDIDNAKIIINALRMAKTVDTVQVVRCKDCRHRYNAKRFCTGRRDDWYCADGVRREP